MRPRVVFFDIGQTLATGGELSARRLLGARLALSEKEVKALGRAIMTLDCREPQELAAALESVLPRRSPDDLRSAVEDVWKEQEASVREIPGAAKALAHLQDMGLRLGVVSNVWHPFYEGFLRNCPEVCRLLDFFALSFRMGVKKPSVEIFQRAVAAAGATASECWMVGDSYELDIEPARKAGLRTLWVLHRPERENGLLARVIRGELPPPGWAVERLSDIPHYFRGIRVPNANAPDGHDLDVRRRGASRNGVRSSTKGE